MSGAATTRDARGGRTGGLGRLARGDRTVILSAATLLFGLSWIALIRHPEHPAEGAAHLLAPHAAPFDATTFAIASSMWFVMMVAMMLPAVMPWILLFAAASRDRGDGAGTYVSTTLFTAGYFSTWALYGLAGAAAQLLLQRRALLGADLKVSAATGGVLLVVAGLFQLTPLKSACLAHCRSPLGYFLAHWRDGPAGAFGMGARHGFFCVACCWALMALGFALGVMNLLWMAFLALMLAVEQIAPRGVALARAFGALLCLWGVGLMAGWS